MAFNGSGSFTLSQPAFVPGTTISSSAVNSDLSDIATNGLSKCVTIDGQNTITGQLKFPNGSAAAPAVTFGSDLTTGMYYIGSKHLGFSTGGTEIAAFNSNNQGSGQSGNVLEINTPSGVIAPFPVGMCVDFCGTSAPAGWLFCFGQTLNISSYPELGGLLGSTYGGDGVTTFGVPDARGRATYGKDNMGGSAANRITNTLNYDGTVLGGSGGSQSHTLTTAELAVHSHANTLSDSTHTHTELGSSSSAFTGGPAGASVAFVTGGGGTNFGTTGNNNQAPMTITNVNAGSGNAHTILGPSIILNKIIFAGRV